MLHRQFEDEGGSLVQTATTRHQRSPQILSGQSAAVQAKTMTVLLGGEPMGKNAGQIFRRNAGAIVGHFPADPALALGADADRDAPVSFFALGAGALGVLQEIDENLQDFMFVNEKGRRFFKVANDLNPVGMKSGLIHFDGRFHDFGWLDQFKDADPMGIGLLHGHNFIDVLDVAQEERNSSIKCFRSLSR